MLKTRTFSQPCEEKCISDVLRICSTIVCRPSKLRKAKALNIVWCYIFWWDCRGNLKLVTLGVKGFKKKQTSNNANADNNTVAIHGAPTEKDAADSCYTLYPDSWKVGRKNSWRVLTWSTEIDKIFSLNTRNFDQCVRTAEQGPVNSSGLTSMERNGYVLLYGLMKLPGPTNLSTGARGNFDCQQKELQDSPRVVHKMILAFLLHLFQAQV